MKLDAYEPVKPRNAFVQSVFEYVFRIDRTGPTWYLLKMGILYCSSTVDLGPLYMSFQAGFILTFQCLLYTGNGVAQEPPVKSQSLDPWNCRIDSIQLELMKETRLDGQQSIGFFPFITILMLLEDAFCQFLSGARHGFSFSLLCAVGQLCFGMGSWKLLGLILEPLAADIVQLPDGLIH